MIKKDNLFGSLSKILLPFALSTSVASCNIQNSNEKKENESINHDAVMNNLVQTKKFVQKDNVNINFNDSTIHTVNKGLKEGYEDIRNRQANGKIEESWIYYPVKRSWHEIGINSDTNKVRHGEEKFRSSIKRGLEKNLQSPVTAYDIHNHPGNEHNLPAGNATPSPSDIKCLAYRKRTLQEFFPRANLIGKIVSQNGITTYKVKDEKAYQTPLNPRMDIIKNMSDRSLYESIREGIQEKGWYSSPKNQIIVNYRSFDGSRSFSKGKKSDNVGHLGLSKGF